MPTDDLNIEAKLNFSKRLGGLIKGHQQEMQQVLEENEDLQMLVEQLLKENATLKSQLAEEKTKNTQLQTEIEQLRNRPVHTIPISKTNTSTSNIIILKPLNNTNITQWQLWNNPTVSST